MWVVPRADDTVRRVPHAEKATSWITAGVRPRDRRSRCTALPGSLSPLLPTLPGLIYMAPHTSASVQQGASAMHTGHAHADKLPLY